MNEEQQAERRKLLKDFIYAVQQMRHFQKVYFKNRLSGDKVKAMQWEREVDRLLEKIEKRQSEQVAQGRLL